MAANDQEAYHLIKPELKMEIRLITCKKNETPKYYND